MYPPQSRVNRVLVGVGDVWTWTAICADTKLVPSWLVGSREAFHARVFATDLASRLSSRVQVTTDGHHAYLTAIEGTFGLDVDYAMLVKTYGQSEEGERRRDKYSMQGAKIAPDFYSN